MSLKRVVMRKLVDVTHEWNHELHQAIEARIHAGYEEMNPNEKCNIEIDEQIKIKNNMREFYFVRMSVTASLLLAGASAMVAIVALIVSAIALFG